ncbi:hypothetical protein P4S72_03555 [Vibrio sp. PP-XX7]
MRSGTGCWQATYQSPVVHVDQASMTLASFALGQDVPLTYKMRGRSQGKTFDVNGQTRLNVGRL